MCNMPVLNRCKQWKTIWSTVFWAIYKFSYEFSTSVHLINSPVYQPRVVIKKFRYELLQIIAAKHLTSFHRKTNSRFEEAWKVVQEWLWVVEDMVIRFRES